MSYTDDFLKGLKKRGFDTNNITVQSGGNDFTNEFLEGLKKRNEEKYEEVFTLTPSYDDIAPVKTVSTKDKEDDGWFKKGLFSDGYQFGDLTKTILGTAQDIGEEIEEGIMEIPERVIDAGAYLVGGVGGLFGADELQQNMQDFIKKDLYNSEKLIKDGNEYTLASLILREGHTTTEEASVLGEKSEGLVNSGSQLLATAALQAVGVPWWLTTGVTSFGGEVENASNEGASYGEAGLSAAITAGAEILTEKISGGISFGGSTFDDALTKKLATEVSNKTVRTLSKLGVDMLGEGAEEVLSGAMSAVGQKLTYADDKELSELFSKEDAWDAFIGGAVLGGGMGGINAVRTQKAGVDYTSGMTENEEAVVKKIYDDRVAEESKNGKLSSKDKFKIYDEVTEQMNRGEISTDTIEEVLGGETYKAYKETIDKENALQSEYDTLSKEYDSLYKMKNGEKSDEQADRQAELKQRLEKIKPQVEAIKNNPQREQLKQKLSDEVLSISQGSRLVESYNEKAKRGQAFEADLSKYDEKQKQTVQKAIDSGILNNTRRTHEFVDMVAKISADKGVLFDFTNNAKLKESGFAVDGKTVNGFVTKDGVTVNIQSAKALNSIVGHEVTHILEGTELYTELQNAVKQYAETKGEYKTRLDAITKLYQGVEGADVNAELTADLVGDYLFTDSDFIKKLSTENRNVFQKIYDEIKYLAKVATAGSKEARQLEKAKKAFAEVYRAESKGEKAEGDVKYHISETFEAEIDKTLKNEMPKGSQVKARDFTPEILVENGVKDLPMLITQKHVRTTIYTKEEAQKLGLPMGKGINYHGLGKDLLMRSIDNMDNPSEVYKKDDDHYIIITELQDNAGNNIIVPVKIDGKGTYNDVYIDENQILSAYGRKNLQEYLKRNDFELIYAKKSTALNEGVQYSNISGASSQSAESRQTATEGSISQKNSDVKRKYSLAMVEKVQPKDGNWQRGASTDEVRAAHPTLYAVDEDATTERNPTQVKGTVGSYRKVYNVLQSEGFNGTILDASSGLGYGTKVGIEEYGFKVDDIEPYPDSDYKPKYTDYSTLDKKYDVIISNAVLNVLPQDQRDALVIKMGELLNDGGRMFVNVRGKDVLNASGKIAINEANMEYFIPRTAKTGSYQKGFTKPELVAYLEDALGDGFTVKPTNMFGAVSAIVTKDIRYSLSADSDGKRLTKEQQEYFKDSKVRDENGNLKVMYHGSPNGGFHIFDSDYSDDNISLFFTDSNDVAMSYSGTSETYTAQDFRTAEDFNKFFAEIGATEYSVKEEMHGSYNWFVLYEDGTEIASSETAKMLYDEFRDWSGLGEGEVNYKVYLDIKNPFVVDAEGKRWDDLTYYEDIPDGLKSFYPNGLWRRGTTRDIAKYAKEQGYDGVIFNNIVDVGGYGGSYKPATVAIAFTSEQIKSVANTQPTADPDIRFSLSNDSEGRKLSPAVKSRFERSKVVDEDGKLKVVYHGTASGEFSIFDKSKGSVEGDFGSGFYFTDNELDVSEHYEGGGPDFDNKVARRAEQIEIDEDIDYDEAKKMAEKELYKGSHKFEVYLNIENPAIVGETILFDRDSYLEQYNEEDYEDYDDYIGEVEQLLADDVKNIIWEIERNVDVNSTDGIAEVLYNAYYDGGVGIEELKNSINGLYLDDSDGNLVGNEVTRQIIESLGYDGIIDPTVSHKWNMDMEDGTTHYIVFKPNQIKSVTNENPTDNPDINRSLSAEGEAPVTYGNYNVYGKDVALDVAPVRETAPVQEAADDIAPMPEDTPIKETVDTDYAPAEAETEAEMQERFASISEADAPLPTRYSDFYEASDTTNIDDNTLKKIVDSVHEVYYLNKEEMQDLNELIRQYSTDEFTSRDKLYNEVKKRFGERTWKERDEDIAEIKRVLRSTAIKVDSVIKSDIPDYNAFKKSNFGKIRFSNKGVGVDVVYKDLNEEYPHFFPDIYNNSTDQLYQIAEVANLPINVTNSYEVEDSDIQEMTDIIYSEVAKYKEAALQQSVEAENRAAFESLDDIAPIAEAVEDIAPSKESIAPTIESETKATAEETVQSDAPIKTVKERLNAKLQNLQTELENNKRLREESANDYDSEIARLKAEYNAKPKKTTKAANNILRRIEKMRRMKGNVDADYAKRISDLESKVTKAAEEARTGESTREQGLMRRELHQRIMDNIKTVFAERGYDFDNILKKAKDLSTFATVDNTPQRVMEKALGWKEGKILSDLTVDNVARNETEGIKWLNSFTDRKKGLLAQISKQYNIKPGSKESAAAQMYAEGFYVDDNENIIQYGDTELAKDFPNKTVQANIKGLAKDARIRQIYDETLAKINESRARNAYPEIQKLDNYFLHFRAMDDTFSRLGIPFNPNDIKAKDLPTDLNGVTVDLKPGQPYFSSAMHRTGQRTSFDLLGGLERYLTGAKDQIYHIDDIQTLRALRNYVADTYGQAKGLEDLDLLTEEEAEAKIKAVYGSHLSTFAKFLNEEANVIAGKTSLTDRGLEGIIGRRGITFLDAINRQVGANMVGFNVSSSLTNFIAPVQAFAKTNKAAFIKGFAQTVSSKLGSIIGKTDSFVENNPTIIRRKGADAFYRTPWQKAADVGYSLMSAVDNISTEIIVRGKYNELIQKGMSEQDAIIEADKWTSRLMGDRSLGQQPQLYNSKMLGMITKFQLEVRNQLDSQFYDTIQEAKTSTEDIEKASERNAKTAARVASTLFQLAVAQHLFGKAFEAVAGYNPAFDIISVLIKALGLDDDEESEDTALDNIEQGFLELMGDLPYTSTLTGGRIPISSALPVEQFVTGKDNYGNEKSRWETLAETAPYYLMPGGYGQLKKTYQGLSMFDEDLPISGSYTDSGNLRFPVEDTLGNRVQAGIFGQWASDNARDYFDNEWAPLKEKQIEEFAELDIPIRDYRNIRQDLSKLDTLGEKAAYIAGLDLPIDKKNLLINNIANREEPIDLTGMVEYGDFGEFEYAKENPEKYAFLQENNISYEDYQNFDEDTKEAWTWAYKNPGKFSVAKTIANDVTVYRQYTKDINKLEADKDESGKTISGSRKEKVITYIDNLDAEYGEKIILFKSEYPADDTYNYEIVDYLNNREDISYEEMVTILQELDFTVLPDGTVEW